MNIVRILISIIFVLLVVVPLALLGTCTLIGGGALMFSSLLRFEIGGVILGIIVIVSAFFILKFANNINKKAK